uniref:Uncharacterized protein n=1 Tax=Anopheles maculatus TaxID=74869 RepID=A0A182T3N2_9DIPT
MEHVVGAGGGAGVANNHNHGGNGGRENSNNNAGNNNNVANQNNNNNPNAEEIDRFSFEDSDRFEEDSLCSWSSEPESVCNNWRGWKKPAGMMNSFGGGPGRRFNECEPTSLTELAARCVAFYIPFELVEQMYPPVPEPIMLRIAFWSFPD